MLAWLIAGASCSVDPPILPLPGCQVSEGEFQRLGRVVAPAVEVIVAAASAAGRSAAGRSGALFLVVVVVVVASVLAALHGPLAVSAAAPGPTQAARRSFRAIRTTRAGVFREGFRKQRRSAVGPESIVGQRERWRNRSGVGGWRRMGGI